MEAEAAPGTFAVVAGTRPRTIAYVETTMMLMLTGVPCALRLAGLHPVQLAVIDLLLMTRGLHFVGLGSSTFSNYVMFARFLEFGYPLGTNILVDGNLWLEGLAKLI